MKDFYRTNPWFSLCGLNCGLCPMRLGNYCPGCGLGEGNQGCAVARCSLSHHKPEYCFQCGEFPCGKYEGVDAFDSFITHKNQMSDIEKFKEIGMDAYNDEQSGKSEILKLLLSEYNDGRKKTFFCVAVNLLELKDIKEIMGQLSVIEGKERLSVKERAAYAEKLFKETASKQNVELKLRKKKKGEGNESMGRN